jgi:phosphatidylserine decarboxylase
MILVGAMIVASIETVWAGLVTPPKRELKEIAYGYQPKLKKGEEMGRFKLGSTVILLFGPNRVSWAEQLHANATVRMGELLANSALKK